MLTKIIECIITAIFATALAVLIYLTTKEEN